MIQRNTAISRSLCLSLWLVGAPRAWAQQTPPRPQQQAAPRPQQQAAPRPQQQAAPRPRAPLRSPQVSPRPSAPLRPSPTPLHDVDPRFKVDVDDESDEEKLGGAVPSEESLSELDRSELSLDQEELRQPYTYSLGVAAGVTIPWQKYTFTFRSKIGDQAYHEVDLGAGDFIFEGIVVSRNYGLKINSQSLVYGFQYFLDDEAPIFITPLLGYGQWDGRIKPSGVDPITDTPSSRIDTAFRAQGLLVGVNLGFMWTFENHWFLEYSIFRIGRALILEKSFTESSSDGQRVIIRTLEHPLTWDVLNIKFGHFF